MDTLYYALSVTAISVNIYCRYKLAPFRSQDVRRAVETASKKLPADKREAVNHYLAHSADANRKPQPQDIVDAAMLLDSLKGLVSSPNKHV